MEAALHRNFNRCEKNPGHEGFIPSSQFDISHLPEQYQDTNLVNCVESAINLCVCVRVRYISESRPEFAYPFSSLRGRRILSVGSGWVHGVYMFPDKHNSEHTTCPCPECLGTNNPDFACIAIYTAAHIVFDDSEGENTSCYLFYKEGNRLDACSSAVELRGVWRVFSDITSDRCIMIHITHDIQLAHRLETMVIEWDRHKESYISKCLLYNPQEEPQNNQERLVILVSHPHGCRSHVSVGFERGIVDKEAGRVQYNYDTTTCPGSSGGKIFVIWKDWKFWGFEHTHSRRCMGEPNNRSGNGIGYISPILIQIDYDNADSNSNSEPKQDMRELAEVEEQLAETDLHSPSMVCPKNPGHENFIPIQKFSKENLPADCRHLESHVKALANITALVTVKRSSKERPKTFPGTDTPYPCGHQVGTCWIYQVIRREGRCQCEACQESDEPKTNFAEIIIHTAAHVVFDNSEAKHTTCYLFFDEGRRLEYCKSVVELAGMSRVWSDAEKDTCKIVYMTHDSRVIDRVENIVQEWESARKSLECQSFIDRSVPLGERLEIGASHKITAVVVSHPHGCSKQVSIVHCVSIDDKGSGQTVYTYTTPTCPGSSGACVFVVGKARKSWDENVHSGVIMGIGVAPINLSN